MLLHDIVRASAAVAETGSRLEKVRHLAECLRRLAPDDIAVAIAYLSGELPQGRIGLGPATIWSAKPSNGADVASLTLAEVDAAFTRLAETSGTGSAGARQQQLRTLLQHGTASEQDFLIGLVTGELRQGALEGVLLEAVAKASGIPSPTIRRAVMAAGALAPVARAALVDGEAGI